LLGELAVSGRASLGADDADNPKLFLDGGLETDGKAAAIAAAAAAAAALAAALALRPDPPDRRDLVAPTTVGVEDDKLVPAWSPVDEDASLPWVLPSLAVDRPGFGDFIRCDESASRSTAVGARVHLDSAPSATEDDGDTDVGDEGSPMVLLSETVLRDSAARSVGGVHGGGAVSNGDAFAASSDGRVDVAEESMLTAHVERDPSVGGATSNGSSELGGISTDAAGASTTDTGDVVEPVEAGVEDADTVIGASPAVAAAKAMDKGGLVTAEPEMPDEPLGTGTGIDEVGGGCSAAVEAALTGIVWGVSELHVGEKEELGTEGGTATPLATTTGATEAGWAVDKADDTAESSRPPSSVPPDTAEDKLPTCRFRAAARFSAATQLHARWCSRARLESFSTT